MRDVEQFIPGDSGQALEVSKEDLRDLVQQVNPTVTDEQFDAGWDGFFAMRDRVENPSRRLGAPSRRAGPVLFPPCHCIRGFEG